MRYASFVVVLLSLVGLSCSSPLSDVNVTDPSVLRPAFTVSKSIDNTGTRTVDYQADIYDKNSELVTIQNGSVKLDGYLMDTKTNLLGGQYYDLSGESEVKFSTATKYNFTITLSDGSQYSGTVTSQSVDLYEFNAPSSQSRTQPITVSWKGTDTTAQMWINMTYSFKTDTTTGSGSQVFQIVDPSSGTFTIPVSYFTSTQGATYRVDLTLESEVKGTVDRRFMPGGSIVSDMTCTRIVNLN